MRARAAHAVIVVAMMVGACDSNPTPHPQNDATMGFDAQLDTQSPGVAEPDDIDNEADCATAGAFWDGDACRSGAGTPDAGAEVEADAIDPAADTADSVGPDVADEGDIMNDIEDSGPDAAD